MNTAPCETGIVSRAAAFDPYTRYDRVSCSSDAGAADRLLRRRVRCHHHRAGPGPAPAGSTDLQGAAVALANMDKLCSELPVHCHSVATHHYLMRYATDVTPRLMWFDFAHPVFRITASAVHSLDGCQRTGAAPCRLLCGGFLPGKRHLHCSCSRADRPNAKHGRHADRSPAHAHPVHRNALSFRDGFDCSVEVSAAGARNLLLLSRRLSEAGSAGSKRRSTVAYRSMDQRYQIGADPMTSAARMNTDPTPAPRPNAAILRPDEGRSPPDHPPGYAPG